MPESWKKALSGLDIDVLGRLQMGEFQRYNARFTLQPADLISNGISFLSMQIALDSVIALGG